ncbi:MAG: hypothetical protein KUG63_10995 [Cycloclasticus sp.]|uniref:hypothetical protein n=1 Tax=Cycloclasticus sp. TaxID=2024830 RepID=UPI00257F1D88|nr:hypothetical protein [Cycloclasticus sp.]MBV1899871.1 hypothetical protein [Cycloclasticus sp.]
MIDFRADENTKLKEDIERLTSPKAFLYNWKREVVPLIRTTCLGVIFPVNHAAINGMMVS